MESDTLVSIKTIDTGCGIPKSFRGALFQPFRQADSSLTRPKQGTGLGLSIVKHLVQRMSGEVDVESVEGEGSTFTVKLPIAPASGSPMRPTAPLAIKKAIKVIYRHERTAKLFVELWARHGFTTSRGSVNTPLPEVYTDVDIIWTDVDSVRRSNALRQILHGSESAKYPPLFIVYSDPQELAALEPALSQAKRIVLIKRPVITHNVVEVLQNPEAHLGTHLNSQSRVRFALPAGTMPLTPMEEYKEGLAVPEAFLPPPPVPLPPPPPPPPSAIPSEEGVDKDKVLLVEDNMVRPVVQWYG